MTRDMDRTWPNTATGWFAFIFWLHFLIAYATVCLAVNVGSRGWLGFVQWCRFVRIFIEGFVALSLNRRYTAKF